MTSNNRSTTCYYRTLYSKYGVNDAFLQSRAQRRATGAFLERVDHHPRDGSKTIDPRQHRRFRRAFRETSLFRSISAATTVAAMVALLQAAPVHAVQSPVDHQPQATFGIDTNVDLQLITDDDADGVSDAHASVATQSNLVSLHLITEQPAYSPVSFADNQLLIDEDSDVLPQRAEHSVLTVIDTQVDDWEQLRDAVNAGEVLLLDGDAPLDAIIEKMTQMGSVDVVNIISHGLSGAMLVDGELISGETLQRDKAKWQKIGGMISQDGDLKLYGCNIAKGEQGREFIQTLADLTRADVAASINPTGNPEKNGDWELEAIIGDVHSEQHFSLAQLTEYGGVLAWSGTIDFSQVKSNGAFNGSAGTNAEFYNDSGKAYTLIATGEQGSTYNGGLWGVAYQFVYAYKSSPEETKLTLNFSGSETFDISSLTIKNCSGSAKTFSITSDLGDSATSSSLADAASEAVSLTGFTGVSKLYVTNNGGGAFRCLSVDNLVIASLGAPAADSDGSLTASGTVTEPVAIDTTVDSVGEAVDVFDFTLTDGGTSDGLAMDISQVVVNVSGTASDTQRGNITWRLDGPDATDVSGVYNGGSDTITFSGLSISIADGASEVYTVNAYYNDNTNLTEGLTYILSVDGDTDLTVGGSGTQMGATSAVTNGSGSTVSVTATALAFTTQPAGSTSGSALTTQPVVTAQDAFGNTDVDFTETITVTEASAGSLTNSAVAASSGVATFSGLTYTATADQQSFTLTANDQDGVGSDLPTTDASSVTSDVVATTLVFDTQPVPLTVNSGEATSFTTVPVVSARDGNSVVDTGYSTDITLAEVNGAGSATMTATGDTDGSGATVTITPSSGVSTFTSMQITYTASGGSSENFNLQASSGGLSTVNSSQLTGLVSDSDGSLTAAGGVAEPVAIDTTVDSVGESVDVFDFTLSDGGTADGQAMTISQIVLNVSGTASDTQRSNMTWRLNGNDASNVSGVYNGGSDTLTFSGLGISIADGGSEIYTVNAYYNDNTSLTEGLTYILSVDGDTDLTVGSGTQMGSTSAVTNGSGSTVSVSATALAFTTQPAGSTSGSALTTQPVVTAQDAFGNTDVDFTETITVTEASAGSLTNSAVAASSGVATFSGLTYTATADQQSFTLTANDQDGVGSDLPTTDASSVTSDVVATTLVFDTQPVPLTVNSGEATSFTTVPVVSARDGNNVVDTGYSMDITLAEVNGAGSATMTATGDTDGSGATVTITPSSGVATFTSMQITYTASGGSSENFNLQASSGGLSTANSSQMTGVVDTTPPTVTDGNISISGASGTAGAYIVGDTVTASWNNTAGGDNNSDVSTVTVDFSQFGGGATVSASNSSETWTATYTITEDGGGSIDATSRNVSVTATDNATNSATTADTTNATVDNDSPAVTDGNISLSGASGSGGAFVVGDTVTATWNNTAGGDNNGDIGGVTVDFSQFGGGAAVTASNSSDTWTATFTVTEDGGGSIDASNRNVAVTATDDGGNSTATADSSNATVDNDSPVVTDGNISISGASGSGGAFIVGDTVTATWDNTAGGDNNSDTISGVTVDFSAFGGGSAVVASNASETWTATYTIVGGAVDGSSLNVTVTATDNAANSTTVADTTNATVDSQAPTVTDGNISLSGASGSGGAFIVGDTVTVTWDNTGTGDNNGDISTVTVDFSAFGGGAAVAASNSADTWTATFAVTEDGGGTIEAGNLNVSVTATDDSGNTTTTADTSNATLDNNSPAVSNVTIPDAAMKVGDAVTVSITAGEAGLSLTSGTVNGVTVTGFSDNGGGSYSATYTIVDGGTDRAAGDSIPVSFILDDSAGNSSATYTTAISQASDSIDANTPGISNVTIPNVAMKDGDAVTVSITASEAGLSLVSGTVNGVSVTGFTDNGGGNYTATYTVASGHTDRAAGDSIPVSFVMQDGAGNVTATYTTAIVQSSDSIDANPPGTATGTLAVDENSSTGTSVGTVTASDTTTYSLTDDASGRFAIDGSTGDVTVADGGLLNFEVNASHSITVRATDSGGNDTDTPLTVTINDVNDLPTGSVTLSGTAEEDQTLTASNTLADEDGLGTISYQWQGDGLDISGATGSTYTLGDSDVGTVITVVASYTDGGSTNESATSGATSAVASVNDAPVVGNVSGDSVVFIVSGTAIELDDGGDATLADVDSADFDGGNVTVAISANRQDAEDQLVIGAVGNISTSGSDVVHSDGFTIGTFVGGSGSDNLVVTLNANATVVRVRDLVSALQYVNIDPVTNNTLARTVSLTVDDGDGGASTSVGQTVTVSLMRAPTLDLDGDDSSGAIDGDFNASFTEGGGEVAVTDSDTTIDDDGGNTHLALSVILVNPLDGSAERLSSTLGTGSQAVGGDVVDIVAYDDFSGELLINVDISDGDGLLDASTMTALMESVRYNNTSDAPTTTLRAVVLTAIDSDSNLGFPAATALTITAVNDEPVFSNLDGAPAFTEGGAAVVFDSNVTLADAELDAANDYGGAILTLVRNGGANAVDAFASSGTLSGLTEGGGFDLGAGTIGTVTTNSAGTLALTFATGATTSDINSVLQQLTYSNNGDAPDSTVQIDWTLSDGNSGAQGTGGALSASGSTTVAITGVNDDPVGAVAINGTATEYQTLTVDTSGLSDADGLGGFSYQWQSSGGNVGSDSVSYSLVASDIGNTVTVTVSYTDGQGTAESVTSTATGVVANENDAPTGSVMITGTVTEDQILTADTSGLADLDGLGTFSYQWQRGGADISGATSSAYSLGDDDVGATLTVTVSYTDGYGTDESLTSDATAAVANVNDDPSGAVTISGTATEDQTLTVSNTLADADGLGTISYQWQRGGADISGATSATYTLTDADVDAVITVVASYTDGQGTVENVASNPTSAVANVNDDPVGAVTISGVTTELETLTAANTLSDDDGLGAIEYQWNRDGGAISGATGDSYVLTLGDVGATITVTASYTDGHGTFESLTSDATAVVLIANNVPVVTAPEAITVDATGLFTEVDLGEATATDVEDGELEATTDSGTFFSPGLHTVTWTAEDLEGAEGSATQIVNVIPLVDFAKDQDSAEGSSVEIKVILNGPAVSYPVTVPFTVAGSAAVDGSDHDLVDGEIVIDSPNLDATITVDLVDDGAGEGVETLEITMGSPINAVAGSVATHIVDIYEANVAPEVALTADQGDGDTRIVGISDGLVVVTANVTDANSGDSHSYDWSGSDNALIDTDSDDQTFTVDPSGLTPGVYTLAVTVSDGEATADSTLSLKLDADLPVLTAADSDNDGIDDDVEGLGDDDSDGIPDFLDHVGVAPNVVPEQAANTDSFLMETEPGLMLALGDVAFRANGDSTNVSAEDIATHANDGVGAQADEDVYAYNGGLFDFNVEELPVAGQSVQIVIPQFAQVPANAVYRKLMPTGWQDFVEDDNNQVASALGAEGFCPPPGDAAYVPGLTEGDWCVQLTIEDGGPNDADGEVNQAVDDPGGVAQRLPQSVSASVSGGGALGLWSLLVMLVAGLARRPGRRVFAALCILGLSATAQADSGFVPDYLGLSLMSVSSDERDSAFDRELSELGLDARVSQSDLDRTAMGVFIGYAMPDNIRIEAGYVDLGDVKTRIIGTAIDVDNFIDSASGVYPVTASGWTLSLGRAWHVHEQVDLLTTLGAFFWNADYTLKSDSGRRNFEEDGIGAQLLIGVEFKTLADFPVRLGWRNFRFDNTDVGAWELGVAYRF